jgi:glycosyltransferase involved in cell wall biosynthesis
VTPPLNIAWFTPLSNRSAIGEFSRHVTAALAEIANITVWTSDEEPYHQLDLPIVNYSRDASDLARLRSADVIVYNMGDYMPFHGQMHQVAQQWPGVVILHDRVLHHLYAGLWLTESPTSPETYVERMGSYYGAVGAEIARRSLEGERPPVWESDEEVLRYPLYEECIRTALGVVVHSEVQAGDIRSKWLGPVRALHLPCYGDVLRRAETITVPSPSDAVRLLTIGHLNPNKQVDRVVAMLGADPAVAARVQYTIVGPDDGFKSYVEDLRKRIASFGEAVSVALLGWRPGEELDRLMAGTDVFVNLRYPVMEGSSASLMRQLAFGRAILCFDEGFFGELPEGTVARVPAGDFDAAARALSELVESPERRRALGLRARELAASYSELRYASGLLELIEESRAVSPGLGLLDGVARELGAMHVDPRLPVFDDISRDFARILPL